MSIQDLNKLQQEHKQMKATLKWCSGYSEGSRGLLKNIEGLTKEHKHVLSLWFKEIEKRSSDVLKKIEV